MRHQEPKISDQEIRNLVIARLQLFSSNRRISIGGSGSFTKEQLIEKIKHHDPVGQKIIDVQLNYLRSFKNQRFLG